MCFTARSGKNGGSSLVRHAERRGRTNLRRCAAGQPGAAVPTFVALTTGNQLILDVAVEAGAASAGPVFIVVVVDPRTGG